MDLKHAIKKNKFINEYSKEYSFTMYKIQLFEDYLFKLYKKVFPDRQNNISKVILEELCSYEPIKFNKQFFNNTNTILIIRNKLVHFFFIEKEKFFQELNKEHLICNNKTISFSNENIIKNLEIFNDILDIEISTLTNLNNKD